MQPQVIYTRAQDADDLHLSANPVELRPSEAHTTCQHQVEDRAHVSRLLSTRLLYMY